MIQLLFSNISQCRTINSCLLSDKVWWTGTGNKSRTLCIYSKTKHLHLHLDVLHLHYAVDTVHYLLAHCDSLAV